LAGEQDPKSLPPRLVGNGIKPNRVAEVEDRSVVEKEIPVERSYRRAMAGADNYVPHVPIERSYCGCVSTFVAESALVQASLVPNPRSRGEGDHLSLRIQ
jgi:hypothetical protein